METRDYITLSDGRKIRVLINCNSLGLFNQLTGKDLTEFASMKADVFTLRTIAYCSAIEGEDADGRKLDMSEKDFGRLLDVPGIAAFSRIMSERASTTEQKKSEGKGKGPLIHFRNKT